MDEFDDKELSKALKLGQKERRKEANLAATMCTAIAELGMVEREGTDPNVLLRALRMGQVPEWEGHLLGAMSLLSRIDLAGLREQDDDSR